MFCPAQRRRLRSREYVSRERERERERESSSWAPLRFFEHLSLARASRVLAPLRQELSVHDQDGGRQDQDHRLRAGAGRARQPARRSGGGGGCRGQDHDDARGHALLHRARGARAQLHNLLRPLVHRRRHLHPPLRSFNTSGRRPRFKKNRERCLLFSTRGPFFFVFFFFFLKTQTTQAGLRSRGTLTRRFSGG